MPLLGHSFSVWILTGVELVQTVQSCKGESTKTPSSKGTGNRELALVEVVGQNAVEADVRVNDEGECESAVKNGRGAVLGETNSDEGYECDRESTLESPVVRSMCGVGLGVAGWVVDGTLDVGCMIDQKELV